MYSEDLRKRFPALAPVVDDLFLLEPHQIACLPQRAPRGELAAVLRKHPKLVRFFSVRHPPIEPFLSDLLHASPSVEMDLAECEDRLLWELADLIVYQRDPAKYDSTTVSTWSRDALREAEPLEDKVVADVGAGTGQVTFAVAPIAEIARVVRPGGVALHLTGMPFPLDDDSLHERLLGSGYKQASYDDGEALYCKYFREL